MSADAEIAPGALLLAAPMLQDPNFRRTVILMCEHQPEEGSFGLVLDRPLDVSLGDVMDGVYAYDPDLYLGGPVQRDTLHFLHRRDDVPGSIPLRDGVHWGGDFDVVSQLATAGDASSGDLRFFLGYTGWGPGQLEAEMDEEAWITAPTPPDLLFPPTAEGLWNTILRRMGGEYAYLANFPDDPRMN